MKLYQKQNAGGVGVFLLIISVFGFPVPICTPIEVSGNPLSANEFLTGKTIAIAENVSMPMAEVLISISSEKSSIDGSDSYEYTHAIEMNSNFQISSGHSQNVSIAFAYPETWGMHSDDVNYLAMEIRLNQSSVPFTTMNGSEIEAEPNILNELEYLHLAIINASLIKGFTYILEVDATIRLTLTEDIFSFRYYVGSANTWEGETHETVQFAVEREDFINSIDFYPDDYLSTSNDSSRSIGTWSLEFPMDVPSYVRCSIYHYEEFTPSDSIELLFQLALLLSIPAFLVVIVLFRYRRSSGGPAEI